MTTPDGLTPRIEEPDTGTSGAEAVGETWKLASHTTSNTEFTSEGSISTSPGDSFRSARSARNGGASGGAARGVLNWGVADRCPPRDAAAADSLACDLDGRLHMHEEVSDEARSPPSSQNSAAVLEAAGPPPPLPIMPSAAGIVPRSRGSEHPAENRRQYFSANF